MAFLGGIRHAGCSGRRRSNRNAEGRIAPPTSPKSSLGREKGETSMFMLFKTGLLITFAGFIFWLIAPIAGFSHIAAADSMVFGAILMLVSVSVERSRVGSP